MEFFVDKKHKINENELSHLNVKDIWIKYQICQDRQADMLAADVLDDADVPSYYDVEEDAKKKLVQLLRTKVYMDKVSIYYFMKKKLLNIDKENHFNFDPPSYDDVIIAAGYDRDSTKFISLRFSGVARIDGSIGPLQRNSDRGYVLAETFQGDNLCRYRHYEEDYFQYKSTYPLCEILNQNGNVMQQPIHSKRDIEGYKSILQEMFPNAIWMMTNETSYDNLPEHSQYDDFDRDGRYLRMAPHYSYHFNITTQMNNDQIGDDVEVPVQFGSLEKYRNLKKICDHDADFDEDYLNEVKGLYKMRRSISRRVLCNEIEKLESEQRKRCRNEIDAVSQESVNEIPAPFLYRYKNRCYNILDFDTSSITSMRDPFTNELLPNQVIDDIKSRIQDLKMDAQTELLFDDSNGSRNNHYAWYYRYRHDKSTPPL